MELLGAFLTGVVGPLAYLIINKYVEKNKDKKRDKVKENIVNTTLVNEELLEIREEVITRDANEELDVFLTKKYGKKVGEISVTVFEPLLDNAETGGAITRLVTEVKEIVTAQFGDIIATYKGSPTILGGMLDQTLDYFVKGKAKTHRISDRSKTSQKDKRKKPTYGLDLKGGSVVEREAVETNIPQTDLRSLIDLVNREFHDYIERNMGKGSSKSILNYQTGRFAKSAKLKDLYPIKEKSAIGAKVKYMKNPYGTFEPGGRLHLPGRDPHRIFAKSIRQILVEQTTMQLRRVRVDLSG